MMDLFTYRRRLMHNIEIVLQLTNVTTPIFYYKYIIRTTETAEVWNGCSTMHLIYLSHSS
jgi:hypothetical protein